MVAGKEPVEQAGARAADMEEAGRRGREAGDDIGLRSRGHFSKDEGHGGPVTRAPLA